MLGSLLKRFEHFLFDIIGIFIYNYFIKCFRVVYLNRFLKILCVFLSILLIVLCVVLGILISDRNAEEERTMMDYQAVGYREYSLSDDYIKLIGRSVSLNDKLYFSYSGSGIEFICKGAYAEITLCAERAYGISVNHQPRFAVYADGNLIIDECIDFEERTYRIDTSYQGTRITVIKLSEAMYSSFAVSKIASYGNEDIMPAENKDLKIEFIGDSITCGYGIDEGAYGTFSTKTENFSKTYAYLTSQKLNADYSAVCFSGYGVVSGFTDNGIKNDKLVMNEYEKAGLLSDSEPLWNFNETENDLIVVNLGTNDASYCSDSYTRRLEFIEAYISLLEKVRQRNPSAYILCILGDMNNSLFSSIGSAVSSYIEKSNDVRVEAFMTDFNMAENDIVINGHPGEKSNEYASEVLTEKINSLINSGLI